MSRRSEAIRTRYGAGIVTSSNSRSPSTPNRSVIGTQIPPLAKTACTWALHCERIATSLDVGSLTGSAIENEASLQFSATHRVAPMTEVLPFEDAPAAYERMMSGQARFRVVLDMQTSSQMGTQRR